MSAAALLLILFLFCVVPFAVLYLIVEDETADPTTMTRSEAEKLAREQSGRPSAHEDRTAEQNADDAEQWGTADDWGSETNDRQ